MKKLSQLKQLSVKFKRKIDLWAKSPLVTPNAQQLFLWLDKGLEGTKAKVSYKKKLNVADVVISTSVSVRILPYVEYELELLNSQLICHEVVRIIDIETDINGKGWCIPANAIEDQIGVRIHWSAVIVKTREGGEEKVIIASIPEDPNTVVIRFK